LGVSRVGEGVSAFVRDEGVEDRADPRPCGFGGAFGGFAQQVLGLGDDLFDRVEVGL